MRQEYSVEICKIAFEVRVQITRSHPNIDASPVEPYVLLMLLTLHRCMHSRFHSMVTFLFVSQIVNDGFLGLYCKDSCNLFQQDDIKYKTDEVERSRLVNQQWFSKSFVNLGFPFITCCFSLCKVPKRYKAHAWDICVLKLWVNGESGAYLFKCLVVPSKIKDDLLVLVSLWAQRSSKADSWYTPPDGVLLLDLQFHSMCVYCSERIFRRSQIWFGCSDADQVFQVSAGLLVGEVSKPLHCFFGKSGGLVSKCWGRHVLRGRGPSSELRPGIMEILVSPKVLFMLFKAWSNSDSPS